MPALFGFGIDSASIDEAKTTLTVNFHQGGENQYPCCAVSVDDGGLAQMGTITAWSDTQATATFTTALPPGTYNVTARSADNEIDTLAAAFTVSGVNSACEMLSLRLALSGAYYSGGY
jgi:hypothetical protein